MNKLFAIAFMCIYLLMSVGVAKTTHYCMGQEKHSSLFSFTTKKCPCSLAAREKMPCCDDEQEVLRIEDDHANTHVTVSPAPQFSLICEVISPVFDTETYSVAFFAEADSSGPPPKVPRYQSFCSLVFYDVLV